LKGVESEDCASVSKLIGIKVFVNEFVAYSELGNVIKFRQNITMQNTFELYRNNTLQAPKGMIWNVIFFNFLF
jgi:nucleoside permease NupC